MYDKRAARLRLTVELLKQLLQLNDDTHVVLVRQDVMGELHGYFDVYIIGTDESGVPRVCEGGEISTIDITEVQEHSLCLTTKRKK